MKYIALILAIIVVTGTPLFRAFAGQSKVRKSLVIALDGLRADALAAVDAPRMHALIDGTWHTGYQCASAYNAQTIKDATTGSGPNHTTIFTGVTAVTHGVMGNNDKQMAAVKFPDYFALLRQVNPSLCGARLSCWAPDRLVPSGADYVGVAKDAATAAKAAGMIAGTFEDEHWQRGRDVDAVLVFLNNPDDAGHATGFGPTNDKYLTAIHVLDGQVGAILDAVAARANFGQEDWQIIITTDHGGYHTNHGAMEADCYTIPLVISSREAKQGQLAGAPSNADVVPTLLQHMGLSPAQSFKDASGGTYRLAGKPRGDEIYAPESHAMADGLKIYLPFNGSVASSINASLPEVIGATPTFTTGKFDRAVHLSGDAYITLAPPGTLLSGNGDWSIAFWYRSYAGAAPELMMASNSPTSKPASTQPLAAKSEPRLPVSIPGGPVILGDKSWASHGDPGFVLAAGVTRGKQDIGVNLADGGGQAADLYRIDGQPGDWQFLVFTFRRGGPAMLYRGAPDGRLQFIANDATALGDIRGALPLNLGQDGTGHYPEKFIGDIDDLAIWNRELSLKEIYALFNGGKGEPVLPAK